MTTRIKITNDGPENAVVWYYNAERTFKEQHDYLAIGQSIEIDIWNGHLPILLPCGRATQDGSGKFFSCPPATY